MTQIITKADIQNFMGIIIDSSLDGYVSTLIGSVQDYIERYCGNGIVERREFSVADVETTRYYNGNDSHALTIDDLREITSIYANGILLTNNDDYYTYPLNKNVIEWIELIQAETRLNVNSRIGSASQYIFYKGQRNVAITGKFGYSVNAPDVIKTVAMSIVASLLKANIPDNDLKSVTQESIGDYSVSYNATASEVDKLGLNVQLDMFKRKPVAELASGKPDQSASGIYMKI